MEVIVDRSDVDLWLKRYVDAWKSYDRSEIESLFGEGIHYRYHPYDEPIVGKEAVVKSWMGELDHADASTRDEPGTFDGSYRCIAVDGQTAVATGHTTYLTELGGDIDRIYDNCYVMTFDDNGRCTEFTEWFMQRPSAES